MTRDARDPSLTEPSGWKAIWKINVSLLCASAAFGLAWLFWQLTALDDLGIVLLFAGLCALVAVKHAIIALIEIVRWVLRTQKWARYRRQGAVPKADRIATEADLRARGLIK